MQPTLKTDDIPRQTARLEQLAALAPERRKKVLGVIIREMERQAKKIAISGGVFSKRSRGPLARSLRGRVYSSVGAGLEVGVQYGLIQDHGGVTKPHEITAKWRPYVTTFSRKKDGTIYGKKTTGKTGGVLAFQIGGKLIFRKSVKHPGSRIPATHYSWKAWLATREYALEQTRLAMLGRASS